jgi:predicted nucleic acid-binding protein
LIVIDASVAVKWIVNEPDSSSALLVRDLSVPLIAPDLMLAEFANVMRRKLRTKEVTSNQLDAGVSLIKTLIDEFIPTSALIESALELAKQLDHAPYDCIYLACALKKGVLLTADSTFLTKCSQSEHSQHVLSLDDLRNGRAAAILVPISIGIEPLREIERLTPLVVATERAVVLPERNEEGKLKLSSLRQKLDSRNSPAAISLDRIISKISKNDVTTLLALGQLGGSNAQPSDWSIIFEQSKNLPTASFGFSLPLRSQNEHAYAGLKKLRAHFGIKND